MAREEGRWIIGVDEAGRGPLCGPVVAGAAALADPNPIEGLACSKTLSPKRRAALYAHITAHAPAWALAQGSVEEIDELNILQASLLAMHRAVDQVVAQLQLPLDHVLVLVDGNRLPQWPYRSVAVVKGDEKVPAISAGSILAKVNRDRWCEAQARLYPQYGLDVHMGYPTPMHLERLQIHGASPIHRRSFGPVQQVLAAHQSQEYRP
ncbi:ribonuclease HII [Limnobacter humi]|uniref:Ribonuclease HII n=2 Tax=Limnobacter humi TaxID=1778671 RepID=A0ABT1WES3_9BURK|nr:ribonuclease HII [Limnobacter humi]